MGSNTDSTIGFAPSLPEGSIILADKASTDYDHEDLLKEVGLHLKAQRKKTVFSRPSALFARKIHAVTPRGFELKIVCFLLAFPIQCL